MFGTIAPLQLHIQVPRNTQEELMKNYKQERESEAA
jgi:hypothetical protein